MPNSFPFSYRESGAPCKRKHSKGVNRLTFAPSTIVCSIVGEVVSVPTNPSFFWTISFPLLGEKSFPVFALCSLLIFFYSSDLTSVSTKGCLLTPCIEFKVGDKPSS